MSGTQLLVIILLTIGVGAELLCCLGLLLMRNVYNRLHYASLASLLGPIVIAVAVLVQEGLSQSGIKAIMILLVLVMVSPVMTHATARAIHLRETAERADNLLEGE
jgi:multicomponent Na+:H+ antiporter subunit G